MALVDTECFMIYYITIISLEFLTNQRQQKGKKNKNIIFFVHRQSVSGNRQKMK